jgi:alpha-glucuronidase
MRKCLLIVGFLAYTLALSAEGGYRLWLRYDRIANSVVLQGYDRLIANFQLPSSSPTLAVAKQELSSGLQGLLAKKIGGTATVVDHTIIAGTPAVSSIIKSFLASNKYALGNEGFVIRSTNSGGHAVILIAANSDIGVLYGVFQFLRLLQTQQPIEAISLVSVPKIQNRILNHWDNLSRTIERGYAGASIWNWQLLPGYIDQRYVDYARANASIGINGTVLTNVNANAWVLTKQYLEKVAALANVFRPYGIRVYLTARFSAPIEIGGLKTADPLDPAVQQWWKKKVDEIFTYVPDFGGFLVKANSEGQPGPQTYDRTHADGANALADALAPHHAIVIWRAFVYDTRNASNPASADRFKQAYNEFTPLDGKFRKNVLVQVKNGPIDFQPREPFSPLFGAMPHTPLVMEFELTQEYLGQATHLVYEAPLFKECLDADTYAKGKGSTVAKIIDGSCFNYPITAIAGVANIGNERNWTGHPFGQANWYAFGRLAWDYDLSASQVADEWLRQTFSNDAYFVDQAKKIMLMSREAMVNYMTPLGLHHIMGTDHHYGPAPWVNNAGRADWNPVYYHRADSTGIGFDRTAAGSNALAQYHEEVQAQWNDLSRCDEKFLLWFHHVPWTFQMRSGRTFWNELCYKYYSGVDSVRQMQHAWAALEPYVDPERFRQVKMLLGIQETEAVWWRNACLLYFGTFSHMPLPDGYEKPDHDLDYYKALTFPFAPGIKGNL